MRLLSIRATHFGSYKHIDFTFNGAGLSLVHGPTGCGKSTLMDLACWTLYAQTAKGGAVDDVRSWGATEPTTAQLDVGTPTGMIIITRKRGKQHDNDLYWQEYGTNTKHRGKDITETQKLLNTRLGCGPELFLSGSYSFEFSATGAFFTAKAKDRRALFENLADLQLPARLADGAAGARKDAKKLLEASQSAFQRADERIMSLGQSIQDATGRQESWIRGRHTNIMQLQDKEASFEAEKAHQVEKVEDTIEALEQLVQPLPPLLDKHLDLIAKANEASLSKCDTCQTPVGLKAKMVFQQRAAKVQEEITLIKCHISKIESLTAQLEVLKSSTNRYTEQLVRATQEQDPFEEQIAKFKKDLEAASGYKTYHEEESQALKDKISCLSTLCDLSSILRAQLLQISIGNIESATNDYLTRFFDGEFRVGFIMTDSDDLDISITKSGHECSFKQLSKGQRRLLVLAFTVAVMKAASEKAGVDFNCVFLDEPADGCDADLKVKTYALFEELATRHESVFIIDHSTEMKEMFTSKYKVELVGDHSEINHE